MGDPESDDNNAVFWTSDPEPIADPPPATPPYNPLIPTPASNQQPLLYGPLTSSTNDPPDWLIGNPYDLNPSADSVQTVTVTAATGGTFTISFEGNDGFPPTVHTTAAIAYDANIAQVQAALDALPNIGTGGVTVTGTPGAYVITFTGSTTATPPDEFNLADAYQPAITVSGSLQDAAATVTAAVTTPGNTLDAFIPDMESPNEFPSAYPLAMMGVVPSKMPNPDPPIGTTKITAFVSVQSSTVPTTTDDVTLYAAVPYPDSYGVPDEGGTLDNIYKSVDGGLDWVPVTKLPAEYFGSPTGGFNANVAQGNYNNAIVELNPSTVYVGGAEIDPNTGLQDDYETTNGGATWTDISIDINGNGPHTDNHAMVLDANGNLLDGNDGGIYRLVPGGTFGLWQDLNGNLATTQFYSVTTNPTDPNIILGGTQDNGTELFNGNQIWTLTDSGDGGAAVFDPNNPLIAYHDADGDLQMSTDGGNTWTTAYTGAAPGFALTVDAQSRVLFGGPGVFESTDELSSYFDLFAPIPNVADGLAPVTSIAPATYQGKFAFDDSFPNVTDIGPNSYDPNTIYISDGLSLYVTKDNGITWVERDSTLPPESVATSSGFIVPTFFIQQIVVDPRIATRPTSSTVPPCKQARCPPPPRLNGFT